MIVEVEEVEEVLEVESVLARERVEGLRCGVVVEVVEECLEARRGMLGKELLVKPVMIDLVLDEGIVA